MIKEQLEQLARIYNTLLTVETKGENSFTMTDCLRALEQVIKVINATLAAEQEAKNGEEG